MNTTRTRTLAVFLAVLGLFSAGCGLKPDVSERLATSGGGGFDGGGGLGTGGGTAAGTSGTGLGGTAGTGGTGATGGGTGGTGGGAGDPAAGGGDPAAGGGDPAAGGGGGAAVEGDRTGISDTEIVIGIHAPVTGAAPFPQNSFERGKDIYFQFINETRGGIHGRRVRVVFRDDRFDPRSAVAACREMVENDGAFLLIGGGGSDQIGACAEYANSVGVPYLSAGVQTSGLDALRGYFALSMSYAQQAPLLAQLIAAQYGGQRVAVVVAEGENLDDYFAAQVQALRDAGIEPVATERIPKSTSQADALGLATRLSGARTQVVVFNASPVSFLNVAAAGAGQGFRPRYVGPGVTNGLNTVATVGCAAANSVEGAQFFSPFPQLDAIDGLDPDFRPAYQRFAGAEADDLGIALWGLDKLVATMLEAAGPDVSRQSFVALLESGQTFQTGVFPPVAFSAQSHFGGSQVHLLQADCGSRSFRTTATFAAGF